MREVTSGDGYADAAHHQFAQWVQRCYYDVVISTLRRGAADANDCLHFDIGFMTGLEYSVFRQDWRMASIFFIHGADPACNELASVLQMFDPSAGYDNPTVMSAPDDNEIPGFDGLRTLVEVDDVQAQSFLWMMEKCYKGDIDPSEDFRCFLDAMEVTYPFPFGRVELENTMLTSFLGMMRCNFTHQVMQEVAQNILLNMIWIVLEDIALLDYVEKDREIYVA